MKTKNIHHPYVKADKEQKVKDDPTPAGEMPILHESFGCSYSTAYSSQKS